MKWIKTRFYLKPGCHSPWWECGLKFLASCLLKVCLYQIYLLKEKKLNAILNKHVHLYKIYKSQKILSAKGLKQGEHIKWKITKKNLLNLW